MKAVIIGTPLQLEGEPAEIAQVAELMTAGAVMVEHVHKWRIGELTDEPTVKGSCWCGQERDFNPQLPEKGFSKSTSHLGLNDTQEPRIEQTNPVAVPHQATGANANAAGKRPFCENCGRKHKVGNCSHLRAPGYEGT